MRRSLVVLVLFLLSGCVNPFIEHYTDGTGGADLTKASYVVLPSGEPKLEQGTNPKADSQRMLEDGYGFVGRSFFRARGIDTSGALEQAKAVHAEVVIVYVDAVAPVRNARGKPIYKQGFSDCLATYWIKMKPQVFGVNVSDLTQELQVMTGAQQGVYVVAVVKGSAAERAGIVRGDVIQKIGDVETKKPKELVEAVARLAGQKVTVELWREYQVVKKDVELGRKQ